MYICFRASLFMYIVFISLAIYLHIVYILTQVCMVTKLSCGIKQKAKAVYSYD